MNASRTWSGHGRGDLRIGDAERDEMTAALCEHFAQGRLTREELDERLDRTLSARTVGELAQISADLPAPSRLGEPGARRGRARGPRPYRAAWPPSPYDTGRRPAPYDADRPRGPYGPDALLMPHGSAGPPTPYGRHPGTPHGAAHPRHEMIYAHLMAARARRRPPHWPRSHRRHVHPPFAPLLIIAAVLTFAFGFTALKVLLAIWLGAALFSLIRRRHRPYIHRAR